MGVSGSCLAGTPYIASSAARNRAVSCPYPTRVWDFSNCLLFFHLRQSAALIFCSTVAQRQHEGGLMHLSTVMVLLLLTFGNMLLFTFGLFVLWLAGEIGEGHRIGDGSHE